MNERLNEILILKGDLKNAPNNRKNIPNSLKPTQIIYLSHLRKLAKDLESIIKNWNNFILPKSILVTTDYCEVIAKSNRIQSIFRPKGKIDLSTLIKGARFEKNEAGEDHHVMTYLLPRETVEAAHGRLLKVAACVENFFQGSVNGEQAYTLKKQELAQFGLSRTCFVGVLKDAWYVTGFRIAQPNKDKFAKSLVSLYRVGNQAELISILRRLEIDVSTKDFLNEDTLLLNSNDLERLVEKAGWLIAMEVRDLMELDYRTIDSNVIPKGVYLPKPSNEPVIGVIDTRFDKNSFFSEWVEYHDLIPEAIEPIFEDFNHGTAVSSLVVNGPGINPDYDDGCGLFRVKHFAVAGHGKVSTFDLLRNIQNIVKDNQDIKVWNLSLGSKLPVDSNFISPEGAELDRLQKKYDVLFIVSATNDEQALSEGPLTSLRVGAPADSLNSIVVGACDRSGQPASYSRRGPVLNFFIKPDLMAFGGTSKDRLFVCTPTGRLPKVGTSFASPWVARKAAYLIHKLQLSRTEAKTLLIDAAVGWNKLPVAWPWIGRGILPQRIEDIITVPKDEIRFIISGIITNYETYSYDIPIPRNLKGKYDYSVRATLCYSPECRRDQGIDYPLTELDLHFGRVSLKNGRFEIRSIDDNRQNDKVKQYLSEKIVRSEYRKWDNVKVKTHFCRRVYGTDSDAQTWGVKIYAPERLKEKFGRGLPFTLLVTLKSIDGSDRTSTFIKSCQAKGWIVNPINVKTRLHIASQIEEDITLYD